MPPSCREQLNALLPEVTRHLTNHALEMIYIFRFEQTINDETTFEVFSFFHLTAIALKYFRQKFDWFANVTFFKHQNDVTPSMATIDVIFQWQLTSAGARFQNCDFIVSYNTIF